MRMQLIIDTEYGSFTSEIVEVSQDQYQGMLDVSKNFHDSLECFNMTLELGGSIFIPPEITKKSILTVRLVDKN